MSPAPSNKRPSRPRVLVLLNLPGHTKASSAYTPAVDEIMSALKSAGCDPVAANADDDVDRIGDAVVVYRPGLVFNLIEHFYHDDTKVASVVAMLDLFGYPCTGSEPLPLATCQDRARCHLLLRSVGVPVPQFTIVRSAAEPMPSFAYPVVVSHGVDDIYDDPAHSPRQQDERSLRQHIDELLATHEPPLLVEEHLAGPRLQAVFVAGDGAPVLPITERIRNADGTAHYRVAEVPDHTEAAIRDLARRALRALGCRDIAQIDFVRSDDGPSVLGVRPVVRWLDDGPLQVAARAAEVGIGGVAAAVLKNALARIAPRATTADADIDSGPIAVPEPAPGASDEPTARDL